MTRPVVTHITNGYLKKYPTEPHEPMAREIFVYTELKEFVPRLIDHGEDWLLVEGCTPILALHPRDSFQYAQGFRELLQELHNRGYWHRDAAVVNMVIHPERGPLLIDFENLTEAVGDISYDLYGAKAAGVFPAWGDDENGVYWDSESTPWAPGFWWEGYSE